MTDSESNSNSTFFRASDSLRKKLKEPLGELILDADVNDRLLRDKVFNFKDEVTLVASVGDRTTARLIEFGFAPDLEIIDNFEKRGRRNYPMDWYGEDERLLKTVNPPGGIDSRAISEILRAFDLLMRNPQRKVRLVVDGEEDLLVLPIVALYEGRSMTMYGQPNEGLVIVDSLKSRDLCKEYLKDLGIEVP